MVKRLFIISISLLLHELLRLGLGPYNILVDSLSPWSYTMGTAGPLLLHEPMLYLTGYCWKNGTNFLMSHSIPYPFSFYVLIQHHYMTELPWRAERGSLHTGGESGSLCGSGGWLPGSSAPVGSCWEHATQTCLLPRYHSNLESVKIYTTVMTLIMV